MTVVKDRLSPLLSSALLLTFTCDGSALAANNGKELQFWQERLQKGANIFSKTLTSSVILAAHEYSIDFVRLAPDKFTSDQRDFLIGDADNYQGLVFEDLSKLKKDLDLFHQQNIPVVLTMLSLPGSRWKQNNHDMDDLRLWNSSEFQRQASKFWRDLATELKDHPGIVGYNILNEPHFDKLYNDSDLVQTVLFRFNSEVIRSIREVDQVTPIILDSSGYASPDRFDKLRAVEDKNVLYSFHMYEPFVYTNRMQNRGRFAYPGYIPSPDSADENKLEYWDKAKLKSVLEPVKKFQELHGIPSEKILVGEFGGHRTSKGLEVYFQDLVSIFKEYGWHWGVYAFREDTWDGMNYELGSENKGPWMETEEAIKKNGTKEKEYASDNPIFNVLKEEWASR